jgi:regulator of nucleoside diphosphate kinase
MTTVTTTDYRRLIGLVEFSGLKTTTPTKVSDLYEKLTSSKKLPAEQIEKGVVTMNSRVLLRDVQSGRESEVTITYPHEAEHRNRLVSILSPIGVALLGRKENDVVSWKVPTGVGYFEIVKVTYQPEAAGHYHL